MNLRIRPSMALLATAFLLPISVISRQLSSDNSCPKSAELEHFRPDQLTAVISGFSEERIHLIQEITAAYSTIPIISSIVILWCNPATPDEALRNLTTSYAAVIRSPSASLNHRFYPWELIRTRGVLICDDDVLPNPNTLAFAFSVWRSNPRKLIGFFARSHSYDIESRSWIYAMGGDRYSIILTKLMIIRLDYLISYTCDERYSKAREIVEEMNNCEDILMNFVVAEAMGEGPVMVEGKIRDFGDLRNDGVSKDVGLSGRGNGEHRKRRGFCIREFHRVLGGMSLRYSYGKVVDGVGEQGLCEKGGRLVLCDDQRG